MTDERIEYWLKHAVTEPENELMRVIHAMDERKVPKENGDRLCPYERIAFAIDTMRDRMLALLKVAHGKEPGHCRTCGKEIYFVKTAAGKTTPYNANGTSHFADCDAPEYWRKK
jgi:hypothetical protein